MFCSDQRQRERACLASVTCFLECGFAQPDHLELIMWCDDVCHSWVHVDARRVVSDNGLNLACRHPDEDCEKFCFDALLSSSSNQREVPAPNFLDDGVQWLVNCCMCVRAVGSAVVAIAKLHCWYCLKEAFDRGFCEVVPI